MSKKNLIAGQSGGPTAAINSSLYGVVSEALKHTEEIDHVYGMVNGIEGFLNGTVLDFQKALPGEQLLALTWTPGAYLGSCRYKLPESLEDPVYPKLFQKFEEMNIGWFFYIGGNDSMDTIEIMGRHAGWLTGAAALARKYVGDNPLLIYLPETDFDVEEFLQKVHAAFEKNCNVVVCVSEGIHDKDGTFICEYDSAAGTDAFGHKMLAGCGKYLENLVRSRLGVKARSVELNVSQRCSAAMLAGTDQQEGILAGEFGVQAALNGETGKMIAFKRQSDSPYSMKCTLEDVNVICNEEKTVPVEWITEDGSDVTEDFIRYARPLIQGTVNVPVGDDGLPAFVYRK